MAKVHKHRNYMGWEVFSTNGYHYIAKKGCTTLESYDIGKLHTKIWELESQEQIDCAA